MTVAALEEPAPTCAGCGYDLRGKPADSDRCPECGLTIDPGRGPEPAVPWAHRGRIGKVRAYWKTVLLVTVRPRSLVADVAAPVDAEAARNFWLVTVLLSALPLCFFTAVESPFEPKIVNDAAGKILTGAAAPEGWLVPVMFGVKPATARVLYVLAALTAATRAARPLIRGNPMTLRLRRARTLALYTCAPLLAMPVAFGLSLAIAYLTDGGLRGPQAIQYLFYASVVFASIILVLAPLAWWWAQVVLVLRATDSTLKGASAALLLPLFWLLCAALFLFLIPWLVGYVALLVGALR